MCAITTVNVCHRYCLGAHSQVATCRLVCLGNGLGPSTGPRLPDGKVCIPCSGTLPSAWGAGSFPKLSTISLPYTGIEGSLPASWGTDVAMPRLEALELTGNALTGTLPMAWSNDADFDFLRQL